MGWFREQMVSDVFDRACDVPSRLGEGFTLVEEVGTLSTATAET